MLPVTKTFHRTESSAKTARSLYFYV